MKETTFSTVEIPLQRFYDLCTLLEEFKNDDSQHADYALAERVLDTILGNNYVVNNAEVMDERENSQD